MNEAQAWSRPHLLSSFFCLLVCGYMLLAEPFLHHALFIDLIKYQLILVVGSLTVIQCLRNVAANCVELMRYQHANGIVLDGSG